MFGDFTEGSEPVVGEIRDQLAEPFIAATTAALAEMAGTDVFPSAVVREKPPRAWGDLAAVIRLASEREECLVLSFPTATAERLPGASRMLADSAESWSDDLIPDCMGEVANVVAGQAKSALAGTPYQFTFSLPKVLVGSGLENRRNLGQDCVAVAFRSELGEFVLQVFLRDANKMSMQGR